MPSILTVARGNTGKDYQGLHYRARWGERTSFSNHQNIISNRSSLTELDMYCSLKYASESLNLFVIVLYVLVINQFKLPWQYFMLVLTELAKSEGADWPRLVARILTRLDCSTEPSIGSQVSKIFQQFSQGSLNPPSQ